MKKVGKNFSWIRTLKPIFYEFDENSLMFKRAKKKIYFWFFSFFLIGILAGIFIVSPIILANFGGNKLGKMITGSYEFEPFVAIINHQDKFNKNELVAYLKQLNVMHPEIVMAQAELESGHFTSKIYRENNNMFGMKEAVSRATTAKGTQNGHALYDDWRQSVLDYALYQNRYLASLKTKDDYFQYLNQTYAEVPDYTARVKRILNEEKLEELFK